MSGWDLPECGHLSCGDLCAPEAPLGATELPLGAPLTPPVDSGPTIEDIEAQVQELKSLRLDARALARSGNPALKAEGKRAIARINFELTYLRSLLAKDPS